MPKLPINYENACIYELVCKDVNITEKYIGSTTNLIQRRRQHKTCCNNEKDKQYNRYVYKFIRETGRWDNWDVVLIEKVIDCKDKEHLLKRERFYIVNLKAELNKQIPLRTLEEYREEYRKENKDKMVEYRKENKDKIVEYRKEYRKENKDKMVEYRKEYYETNKDKIVEYSKEYYETNKQKISKQKKEYTNNNKEKVAERHKKYRIENADKIAKYNKDRREANNKTNF
jgi:hypothetical protein